MATFLRRALSQATQNHAGPSNGFGRPFSTTPLRSARLPPAPDSPTFYTGRSAFYDYVASLERAILHSRDTLKSLHIYPLPQFALQSLPPPESAWKSKDELAGALNAKLSASRHRRLIDLLNQLNEFRRVAGTSGHGDLATGISRILEIFERADKELHLRRGLRKPATIDEQGRAYAYGARKTSSARVWVISSEHATALKNAELAKSGSAPTPPVTQILVNNVPLNEYFKVPVDRERILRPFRVAGLLGAFNVFALTRGGGISGQAGAVAHGIAKGLAAHVPDVQLILRRAKLLRRDPRMVERKKTGRAKARKGYTWVKR